MTNSVLNEMRASMFYESIERNPRCSRGNYPDNFNVFLERLRELLNTRFKKENLVIFDWIQNTPTLKDDYFETGEFKGFGLDGIVELPLYHVHVRHDDSMILSIIYDEHKIASMIMNDFYFEIYPLPNGDIERFYPSEMDTLLGICEATIAINYREHIKNRKIIELKYYFDNKSIDRNALSKRGRIK